jgi:hypothetical protein
MAKTRLEASDSDISIILVILTYQETVLRKSKNYSIPET